MLNAATTTMIDSAKNIATRSTSSASKIEALMRFQLLTSARPARLCATGAMISSTRSASSVTTSIMPIVSPVSSSVCASGIGMMTKAWSKSYTPVSKIAATR